MANQNGSTKLTANQNGRPQPASNSALTKRVTQGIQPGADGMSYWLTVAELGLPQKQTLKWRWKWQQCIWEVIPGSTCRGAGGTDISPGTDVSERVTLWTSGAQSCWEPLSWLLGESEGWLVALLLPLWLRAAQHILAHSAQAPAATGAGCRCHRWADMSSERMWHPQRLLRLLLQVLQKRTQHLASLQGDSGHFQQRVKPRTSEDLEAPCLVCRLSLFSARWAGLAWCSSSTPGTDSRPSPQSVIGRVALPRKGARYNWDRPWRSWQLGATSPSFKE